MLPFHRATDKDDELVKNLTNEGTPEEISTCVWDPAVANNKTPGDVAKSDLVIMAADAVNASQVESVVGNIKGALNAQGFVMVHQVDQDQDSRYRFSIFPIILLVQWFVCSIFLDPGLQGWFHARRCLLTLRLTRDPLVV